MIIDRIDRADGASIDALAQLERQLADRPILLLFASRRPEHELELQLQEDALRLEISPFGAEMSVVVERLGGGVLPKDVAAAIVARSGGNPSFAEQLVLAARARRTRGEELDAEALPIPLTIEATVQARIDELPAPTRELLLRLAVFEGPFREKSAQALGLDHTRSRLAELVGFGCLSTRAGAYVFESRLLRDVARGMLSAEQQKSLHLKAAWALSKSRDAGVEEIARHYEQGGAPSHAAKAFAEAAARAAAIGDSRGVLSHAARATALGLEDREEKLRLLLASADAHRFLGDRSAQRDALEGALECAATAREIAGVRMERALLLARIEPSGARAEIDAAIEEAVRSGEHDLVTLARIRQAAILAQLDAPPEGAASLDRVRAAIERAPVRLRALAAGAGAQIAGATGDLGARSEAFARAAQLYREAGDLRLSAAAQQNLADTLNRLGAYQEAFLALTEAVEECQRVGHRLMEGYARLNRSYAATMLRRFGEAEVELDAVSALLASTRDTRLELLVRVYRARTRLDAGTPVRSEEIDAIAEAAARESLDSIAASALALEARALLSTEPRRARALAERALAIRDARGGLEEEEGEVFLVAAESMVADGDTRAAAIVVRRGRSRLEVVGRQISDPLLRARFFADVPSHARLMRWDP
jgi:hypothetical protein